MKSFLLKRARAPARGNSKEDTDPTGLAAIPSLSERQHRPAYFLLTLALALGASAIYVGWQSRGRHHKPAPTTIDLRNPTQRQALEASINRNIQLTHRNLEADKEQVRIEAGFVLPRVGALITRPTTEVTGLDLRVDKAEYNPVRDLHRRPPGQEIATTDSLIQSEIATQQAYKEYEERMNHDYARQVVENARNHGYEIELTADDRVKSVRRVSDTSTPSDTSSSSGSFDGMPAR
ncbi:MAG: hypothetical protein C5B49_07730 [Bdellovibrio sp.]|nr:MAG: hypothetical protein C5B49_07730 [Bdellovibrio sp.]